MPPYAEINSPMRFIDSTALPLGHGVRITEEFAVVTDCIQYRVVTFILWCYFGLWKVRIGHIKSKTMVKRCIAISTLLQNRS